MNKGLLIRTLRLPLVISLGLIGISLLSCSPSEPLLIGFVGGTSGRIADLGIAGLNGAQLAVEQQNSAGGVNGQLVELIAKDDQQDVTVAKRVTRELLDSKVAAIVGPMTSSMAIAITPIVNQAQVLLVSPTVTSDELAGRDDYLIRVSSSTREYASKIAQYALIKLRARRIVAAYDLSNQSYTESWLAQFQNVLSEGGGEIVETIAFESGDDQSFLQIAQALLITQPDSVVVIANSLDSALLCQQVRKIDRQVPIVVSEWGATERLIELGGKAVEGVTVAQFFDRNSLSPDYQRFRQNYLDRFGQEPGFAGVTGFDAMNVVLQAMAARQAEQNLKELVLSKRRFQGVQHPLVFNKFGDAQRDLFIAIVREARFVVVE